MRASLLIVLMLIVRARDSSSLCWLRELLSYMMHACSIDAPSSTACMATEDTSSQTMMRRRHGASSSPPATTAAAASFSPPPAIATAACIPNSDSLAPARAASPTSTSLPSLAPQMQRPLHIATGIAAPASSLLPSRASASSSPLPPAASPRGNVQRRPASRNSREQQQVMMIQPVEPLSTRLLSSCLSCRPEILVNLGAGLLILSYLLLFSVRTHILLGCFFFGMVLLTLAFLRWIAASGGLLSLLPASTQHLLLDYNLLELVKISWHSRTLQDVLSLAVFPLTRAERRRIIERLPRRLAALLTRRGVMHLLPAPARTFVGGSSGHKHHADHAAGSEEQGQLQQRNNQDSSSVERLRHSMLASASQPNLANNESSVRASSPHPWAPSLPVDQLPSSPRSPFAGAVQPVAPSSSSVLVRLRERSSSMGSLGAAAERAAAEALEPDHDEAVGLEVERRGHKGVSSAGTRFNAQERKSNDSSDDVARFNSFFSASVCSTSPSSSSSSASSSSSSSDSSSPDVRNADECPSPSSASASPPGAHMRRRRNSTPTRTRGVGVTMGAFDAASSFSGFGSSGAVPALPSGGGTSLSAATSSSSSGAYRAPLSTFLPLPPSVDELNFANLLDRQLREQARVRLRAAWKAGVAGMADEFTARWAEVRAALPAPLAPYFTPVHVARLGGVGAALALLQLSASSSRFRSLMWRLARLGRDAAILGAAFTAAATAYKELHVVEQPLQRSGAGVGRSSSAEMHSPRSAVLSPSAAGSSALARQQQQPQMMSLTQYQRLHALPLAVSDAAPLRARLHALLLSLAWLRVRFSASAPLRHSSLILALWLAWLGRRSGVAMSFRAYVAARLFGMRSQTALLLQAAPSS